MNNRFYRTSLERFREARGAEASRFCAGCHDPALLLSGAIDGPLNPESPLAQAGIPCRLCHGVSEARADGNGSYVWDATPIPMPDPADPAQIEAHRARVAGPGLRGRALCGSCHRSFAGAEIGSPHHFAGIDDLGAFGTSAYGGSPADSLDADVDAVSCRSCHMRDTPAREDMAAHEGVVASHRFAGGHLELSPDDDDQAEAVREQLSRAVTIDIPGGRRGATTFGLHRERPVRGAFARGELEVDIVIRNVGVGHRFPGGTRDLQDTFLVVRVEDAEGREWASSGVRYAQGEDEPGVMRLRSAIMDAEGALEPLHDVHAFVSPAFDHSLAPRDAKVIRVVVPRPPRALRRSVRARGFRLSARLVYRRHPPGFSRTVCDAERRAARHEGSEPASPACTLAPTVALGEATMQVDGRGAFTSVSSRAEMSVAQRRFDWALGLSHARQEELGEALVVLEGLTSSQVGAAEEEAEEAGDVIDRSRRLRAGVHLLRARVHGARQQLEPALAEVSAAEAILGDHAAVHRARGRAYAASWRWEPAAQAYGEVVRLSPRDTVAFRDLASAWGSAGDDARAWAAAIRGLALAPRDAQLLRSASLAAPEERRAEVRQAALAHREVDDRPALLRRCEAADPVCARDREPLPRVRLR